MYILCGISLIHKHHGAKKDGHHLYFLHDFFNFLFIYGLKIEFMYRLAKNIKTYYTYTKHCLNAGTCCMFVRS